MKKETLRSTGVILVAAALVIVGISALSRHPVTPFVKPSTDSQSKVGKAPLFTHLFTIGNFKMQVAIADTEPLREQGLSDTDKLAADQGMLFVFPSVGKPSFWMKDMRYDLDMIWIGSDKKVREVTEDAIVAGYPNTIYTPKDDVQYVLEVPTGFVAQHHIKAGDSISF